MAGIGAALDSYLMTTHVDHEEVVCAIKIEATFTDVVLRTVGHPQYEGETLGDIIDDETRFTFDSWTGTLVGFRYPDATTGETIPGLHLHAISDDRTSGGHVRNVTLSTPVVAALENFLGLPDRGRTALGFAACPSRLLALSLDQPVTAITSSNKRDFTTRDAIRYARAYFAVISVLADTDNPFLIPQSVHQRRASTLRHDHHHAGITYESRRETRCLMSNCPRNLSGAS